MARKLFTLIAVIVIVININAQNNAEPQMNLLLSGGGYFPKYTSYDFNSPVYGLNIEADLVNLYQNYGIGGSLFYTIDSYDEHFDNITMYEGYLHNFTKTEDKNSNFLYGFYLGFRRTNLEYIEKSTTVKVESYFVRPIIGLKYSSNYWGSEIAWTMNEREKSRFEYDVKLRNAQGWWILIGGSYRGLVKNSDADLHLYLGYELNLGQ